jgi:Ca-activated chloride channel family protein
MTEIIADEAERRPQALQYVIILSDGESTLDEPWTSFRGLRDQVAGGAVLGYGTNDGGQMRSYDGAVDVDPDAPWITDDSGAPAVSRIDEQVLMAVADQLEVPYLHRTDPDGDDLTAWAKDLHGVTKTEPGRTVTAYLAQTWPVAVLLGLALAVEVVLAVPRRTRRPR